MSSKTKKTRLSDSSSSSSSSSPTGSNDEESEEESEKKKLISTTSTTAAATPKANKKVKYSSEDEESGDEEDAESDDDYDDSSQDDDDESEDDDDEESTDIDDSNDSDYNFGSRRKKKKKKTKNKKKSGGKKPLAKASSKAKQATSSSRYKTTTSRIVKKSSTASSTSAQNKSYERRSTARKVVNYCEDNSEESEEEEMNDEEDELDSSEEPVKKSSSKSAGRQLPQPSEYAIGVVNENVETLERVLKYRRGLVGATGSKTAIYNVEELGDPNKVSTTENGTEIKYEDQYLIKWLGWSHLHNTWESKESLTTQKVNGMKKLENFLKKEEEVRQSKLETNMSPEDIEYYECQKEMMDNLLETHQILERIIAAKSTAALTPDYLCKWQGLPYSECTWEDGELIKKRFVAQVVDYEKRQSAQTLAPANVKSQKAMRIRPRFVALKEQPEYLGASDPDCELRDYQLDGLNWLANSWCKQNGVILADEMGLGKTIQSISFISYVFNEHNLYGPFLVVIPLSTIQGWQREFQKWSPEINVVLYLGDISSRNMIQQYELYSENRKFKANVVLTTYEILLKDKSFFNSIAWAALIVDEAHRLKNEDSLLYRTLVRFDTNHRMLITGTPLQNSLRELWALLNFIMPEKFDNWEEFDSKYSQVLSDGLRFQDLHKELQPYLLRRVKKDVEKSLPAKVEQILRVEMTTIQKQYYKLILTKNYKELAKGAKGNVNTFLNLMMELKKCSNHSFLIRRDDGTGDTVEQLIKGSGKLLLLDKLLRRLKETGHRVLIFSQMVRMLDIIAEYLRFRRFPFQRLDGSIKGEIRRQALDHFNKEDSDDFCFLLSTRAGGLGINLATADTVIIYDSDWNPQNDLQAQARAHRIGQKNQVNIYRLVSKNSIEEDIVERAKQKMVLDHLVIQRMDTTGRTVLNKSSMSGSSSIPFNKDEINSILKFGAEELFKEKDSVANGNEEEKEEKEENQLYDIDEILKRAETREETNCLSATEELLSQFKVANFSTMEDEPIFPSSSSAGAVAAGDDIDPTGNAAKRKELEEKSWLDIIPESERRQIDIEEEDARLRMIHLTTLEGRRRTNKPVKQQASDDDENYKSGQDSDSDSSSSRTGKKGSSSKSKKRGGNDEHIVKGLNAQEVRRFVRSYRKFPSPLTHIDTIAQDANLEEKSQAILIEFAQKLQQLCKTSMTEFENSTKDETENDKKKRGPELEINGVKMYAQQVLETETYFEPLTYFYENHKLGSPDPDAFQFKTKLKQTYWDCEWSEEDDKALLRGIYEHGYGNWEWIKTDPALKLENKILMVSDSVADANGNGENRAKTGAKTSASGNSNTGIKLKPQSKHLRTRIDYLIKVLQNQMNVEKYGANWKSVIEPNTPAVNKSSSGSIQSARKKQQESVINNTDENSNGGGGETATKSNRKRHAQDESSKARRKLKQASGNLIETIESNDSDQSEANADAKKKKPNPRGDDAHSENSDADTSTVANKKHNKHHHHHHDSSLNISKETTNAAMALSASTQSNPSGATNSSSSKEKKILLDEKTFEECKNILRPVKRALKDINIIESSNALTDKTHLDQVRRLVLDIGDKINDHLTSYNDLEKINKWRNYLWAFVAKFTTSWNFERIKNLYKKFAKNRDDEQLNSSSSAGNMMNNSYHQSQSYGGYRYKGGDDKHSSSYNSGAGGGQYDSSRSKKPHFDSRYNSGSGKEKSSSSGRNYASSGGGGGGSGSRREFHGGQSSGYRHNNSVNNDNSHDGTYSQQQRMDSMTNDRKPRFQSHHSGESLQWSPGGDEYRKFNRSYRNSGAPSTGGQTTGGNNGDDYYHQHHQYNSGSSSQYGGGTGGGYHHQKQHYHSGNQHHHQSSHHYSKSSGGGGPPPPPTSST